MVFLSLHNEVRAAVAFGAAGDVETGTTSLSVLHPAGIVAGDLLVLVVGNKFSPDDPPVTPAGWTLVGQGEGGLGNTSNNDQGPVFSTIFVREAVGGETGNLTVSLPGANSSMGMMFRYSKVAGTAWDYAATSGSDNIANTAWSVTGASNPGIQAGDMLIVGSAINTDNHTYSVQSVTSTGATFGAHTERQDSGTGNGRDMQLVVSDHTVTAGTATAAPVFTMTASGTATNRPTGASVILRIREVPLVALAYYAMNESSWNGTANEVADSSGNATTYPGTAASLNATKPSTASATPAIAGNPGTCRYGVFNRTNKDYVALPAGFQNLGASGGAFTIAAWIRTTNNTLPGQRIFVDDENNTGGFGFSLADGGNGMLRFFTRGTPSALILDTANVIANNTWYFVAAVADVPNKTKRIHVYSAAGVLLANVSASWTEASFGSDAGIASIGAETNASGEGSNAFGFAGNIDEISIYETALSTTEINVLRTRTRPCGCALGSFRLTQAATALACPDTRALVTVEPMCPDGTTVKSDYAGTVSLTTVPVNASAAYFTAASGGSVATSVSFVSGELSKSAYLYYPNEASVCAVASDGVVATTSTSCTSFHSYGFTVSAQPANQVCGDATQVTLTAYGKTLSGSGQACEVITGFSGNKNMKAWFTSGIDPDNTATVQASNRTLSITGSTTGITNKTEPATDNLGNVNFTNGVATLAVSYPNAGKIFGLNFKHDAAPYNGGVCAATAPFCPLTAATNAFIAYPNFALTVTDSGAACVAGDLSCAVFKAAGATFNMKLQALCSDGTTLATDYVNGSTAIPLGVNALIAPSGGSSGSVGTAATSITSGGEMAFTQSWSEVGVASFMASPPAWFGLTFASAVTGNIGRFRPDHFAITPVSSTAACSLGTTPFTYFGQDGFVTVFTLTAQNTANATTANYAGSGSGATSWARLPLTVWGAAPASAASPGFGFAASTWAPSQPAGANLDDSGTAPTATNTNTWVAGTTTVTAKHTIKRPTNPAQATTVTVSALPVDADGVTLATAVSLGSSVQRFGVLRLDNAYGSELLPIRVPARTLYCNAVSGTSCTEWRNNTDDSCTGASLASGNVALGNRNPAGIGSSFSAIELRSNGWWDLVLAKPASAGSLDVVLDLGAGSAAANACLASWTNGPTGYTGAAPLNHLLGNWCGSAYDRNPVARIKFGSPKAPYIYLRERY
ncbi:MAG: LamG domain-containing protein [Rhodocyclaceae bacterium]|nr:LamG domain-containing protein [Rhodocyclaceae bacterium]